MGAVGHLILVLDLRVGSAGHEPGHKKLNKVPSFLSLVPGWVPGLKLSNGAIYGHTCP